MRGLSRSTTELIQGARQLLQQDHPQTLRQLHYAIFSRREMVGIDVQKDRIELEVVAWGFVQQEDSEPKDFAGLVAVSG